MQTAVLRLFRAVQIDSRHSAPIDPTVMARTLAQGYVLDPAVRPDTALLDEIDAVIGLTGEQANAAFHKSWQIVREASLETLVLQQLVHYVTTYGFERLGVYAADTVYVPTEALELPDISLADRLSLVVVRGLSADELLVEIQRLGAGMALADDTLADIMTIVKANHYPPEFIETIGNRELRTRLYDHYGIMPREPVAYLRHLVWTLTGETLLIKNQRLIKQLKAADSELLDRLLEQAPDDLASIFYRYKPLFLALKSASANKTFFNRLRKQAPAMHQPLPDDYLNSITRQLKQRVLDPERLDAALARASVYRKIRLAYALQHRLQGGRSIVYRVRNGRGWATKFHWSSKLVRPTQAALDQVLNAIARDLRPQIAGKTIHIPRGVDYRLPATEKQFTGFFPSGSSVAATHDLVVGVHWTDTAKKRVDLDLSIISASGKFGWDASFRAGDRSVLFSGDMTAAPAPDGASELFYIKGGVQEPLILMLNYFNFSADDPVDATILVADEKPSSFEDDYVVNPDRIIASSKIRVDQRQQVLGLVATVEGEVRVYFAQTALGTAISAGVGGHVGHARRYLVDSLLQGIGLRDILRRAGVQPTSKRSATVQIDLAPDALTKTSFLDLLP